MGERWIQCQVLSFILHRDIRGESRYNTLWFSKDDFINKKNRLQGLVFVKLSQDCHNQLPQLPQTLWLNTAEYRSRIVQESRSVKSGCRQVWFLLEALRKEPSHASLLASGGCSILGIPGVVAASLWSLPPSSHLLFLCLCVLSSSYKGSSHWILGSC